MKSLITLFIVVVTLNALIIIGIVGFNNYLTDKRLSNMEQDMRTLGNLAMDSYMETVAKEMANSTLNGKYYGKYGFYVVKTEGRDYCDIMESDPSLNCVNITAFHELTHAMIRENRNGLDHFINVSEVCKE